ncbi:DNA primase [Flaviflexus equikiangi]|uniref:DNA primase n=1 Tax=Flaviflexus equikiangi TaxID=2758573 RepID=UPI0015F56FB6|nr:DNA primase [Flaviflexus equikiangi]
MACSTVRHAEEPAVIPREDIDKVRELVRIEDIVGDYVSLKHAGSGSMKGLCPFHDEKSPSFHVRPLVGRWHCFGCGEGGDVFSFIEKIEHIPFVEAIQFLARKVGVELRDDARPREDRGVTRARLVDAHTQAVEFYRQRLAENTHAREFLTRRGFEQPVIDMFEVGYSPDSWDELLRHLRAKGFTEKELAATGLFTTGTRGMYDRFRGRLMWPIHSITGETIGFGARILGEGQPKYLNTPDSQLYQKSKVLYGLDLAKKHIAAERQIVIVEGYTDVMAAHIAGVTTAVATCGTAFGTEHTKIVRRLIGDSASPSAGVMLSTGQSVGGEIIFTFDGDAAGQKAALRAYEEDQAFAAQTFIAVAKDGKDPADVWLEKGDEAVKALIDSREPLFAFAIRSVLKGARLDTAEGRVAGLRAAAPMVAGIRDRVLRGEYTRQLAGWLGMDEDTVRGYVRGASGSQGQARQTPAQLAPRNQLRDPIERIERESLEVILQMPNYAGAAGVDDLPSETFVVPVHRSIHDAIRAAGGVAAYSLKADEFASRGVADAGGKANAWFIDQVCAQAEPEVATAISQIAVAPIPQTDPEGMWNYARGIILSLLRLGVTRQIGEIRGRLQRTNPEDDEYVALFTRLIQLEQQKRAYEEA